MTETPRRQHDVSTPLTIDAPARSYVDEQVAVEITGAGPGETVELTASLTDPDGCTWASETTVRADESGRVDLTARAPAEADDPQPMRLLWSMSPEDEDQLLTPLMTPAAKTVRLQATAGSETATRTITRVVADDVTRAAVDRDGFVGTVYEPESRGPHPGVLVLHGSGGSPVDFTAALLARHGCSAFALRYIGDHEAVPERIRRIPLSYFDRAARWFHARDAVSGDGLGVVGHSRGAEVGLVLGARRDWAGPVVSYAGSAVRWDTPMGDPAWLDRDGDPLPAISGQGRPTLCEGQLDDADETRKQDATTTVEAVDGPVLFISGGQDTIWPARRLAERGIDRLDRMCDDHDGEHRSYEDAGHFITPPVLPKNHQMFAGTPAGTACADRDSWPAVLEALGAVQR